MRVTAALPTGVEALFFDSARRRRGLEARLASQLEEAGFGEVILPVVDYMDPYQNMLSRSTRDELYRFVDRDGELLALRGDFTPMLARLIAPRLAGLPLPLKLFYRGDVLRYQEARAGRQRELYQVGAEVLERDGEKAEAEALTQFLDLMASTVREETVQEDSVSQDPAREEADKEDSVVVLGFAGALDVPLLRAGPGREAAALAAAVTRRERPSLRGAGEVFLQVVEGGMPEDPASLGIEAAGRLERLKALCESLKGRHPGLRLRIDLAEFADQVLAPALQSSLGAGVYYDGLVFRAYAGSRGVAVGGGGRYDRLFQSLGAQVSAAGFTFSLGRILDSADPPEAASSGEKSS